MLKPEKRKIYHPYSDDCEYTIQAYCIEEIFAEKLRSLLQRMSPRDLYDVIQLHGDARWQPKQADLLLSLREKCQYKNLPVPNMQLLQEKPERNELIVEWDNMLAHQISDLLPFDHFWQRLPEVFDWLDTEGQ